MQLTRLIYASNHDGIAVEEVDRILKTSRAHNHRDGITGALIVSDKNFLQLLEGDRAAVASCFTRITQDDRHRDVQVISAGDTDDRLFADGEEVALISHGFCEECYLRLQAED